MKAISVFCGSSEGNDDFSISKAYELGVVFAQKEIN